MNKKLMLATILSVLILSLSISIINGNTTLPDAKAKITQNDNGTNSEGSEDIIEPEGGKMYYDIFITLLYPYVEEAINNYYNEYMTDLPMVTPYLYKFISIDKALGTNYSYTIELEVQPYVGPHLSVGRDRIVFKIDLREVTVEKFEHIESYELPPHYQNYFIKNLPMP